MKFCRHAQGQRGRIIHAEAGYSDRLSHFSLVAGQTGEFPTPIRSPWAFASALVLGP
jgi:hypothetical protein